MMYRVKLPLPAYLPRRKCQKKNMEPPRSSLLIHALFSHHEGRFTGVVQMFQVGGDCI